MASTLTQATLSDGLAALIRSIEATGSTGLVMTRRNVATLLDGLRARRDEARHLEIIADRAQWNEKARREALEAALHEGAVTLLPVVPRATAIRGEGGAA